MIVYTVSSKYHEAIHSYRILNVSLYYQRLPGGVGDNGVFLRY